MHHTCKMQHPLRWRLNCDGSGRSLFDVGQADSGRTFFLATPHTLENALIFLYLFAPSTDRKSVVQILGDKPNLVPAEIWCPIQSRGLPACTQKRAVVFGSTRGDHRGLHEIARFCAGSPTVSVPSPGSILIPEVIVRFPPCYPIANTIRGGWAMRKSPAIHKPYKNIYIFSYKSTKS